MQFSSGFIPNQHDNDIHAHKCLGSVDPTLTPYYAPVLRRKSPVQRPSGTCRDPMLPLGHCKRSAGSIGYTIRKGCAASEPKSL